MEDTRILKLLDSRDEAALKLIAEKCGGMRERCLHSGVESLHRIK